MIPGTVLLTIVFIGLAFLYRRIFDKHKESSNKSQLVISIIIISAYSIILFTLGVLRGDLHTLVLGDYSAVYNSAMEMADQGILSYPKYFRIYNNNVMPMLFMSIIFKISHKIGISEYIPMMFLSTATIVGSIWAMIGLLSQESDNRWRIPCMLYTIICLPIYVFSTCFYTDTMSFGLGIISLNFARLYVTNSTNKDEATSSKKNSSNWLYAFFASFFMIYGIIWKITALIPIIAAIITLFLLNKKIPIKKLIILLVSFLLLFLSMKIWANNYEIYKESKKTSNPVLSWIALGMVGDGSWNASHQFVSDLNELEAKEEKYEFTYDYIRENYKEALSLGHIISKAQRNFSGGTIACKDFLSAYNDETFLWNLMNPWGKYYWRTSQYCFLWISLIYSLAFLSSALAIVDIIRKKDIPFVKLLTDISIFGIVVFLMLWESNNRQLFNQLPVLIINLFANVDYLSARIGLFKKSS